MAHHQIVKSFRDYAEDIEAVNIHYVITDAGETPDWTNQRSTRYMPPGADRVRRKTLKLPMSILDSSNRATDRYMLHYYFEIFQDGDRSYSPLYSEEIVTTEPLADRIVAAGDSGAATLAS